MKRRIRDSGNAAAELVILAPVLCLCAVFVFWCGRLGQARSHVELAAGSGARAAAMVSRARMAEVGRSAALSALVDNGVVCVSAQVGVTVLEDRVRVSVQCRTDSRGVEPLDSRVLRASAIAPIDKYRVD